MRIPPPTDADQGRFKSYDAYVEHCESVARARTDDLIDEANRRSIARSTKLAALIHIKHGHKFGPNRRCDCGMTQLEYHRINPREHGLNICPHSCEARGIVGDSVDAYQE